MIDSIGLSIDIGDIISWPDKVGDKIVFGNLEYIACPNTRDVNICTYKAQPKNLLFKLSERNLRINNSIHKFHSGENYSDLSLSKLKTAIKEIEYLTCTNSENIKIHTCELALNIETEQPAREYLQLFSLCNYEKAREMIDGTSVYGIKYYFTEYNIKIYDKSMHYSLMYSKKLKGNILRFEIEYKKSRRLYALSTLADLSDKCKIKDAFDDYFKILQNLSCVQSSDLKLLDSKEMTLYFAGRDSNYWKAEKQRDKEAVRYRRKMYKQIIKKANEKDLMPQFLHCLKLKLQHLLNN